MSRSLETSLRLLRTEAVITSTLLAMPIMNPFFQSIGMDQGQIGLSQAGFMTAVFFLNVPTGWLADRFSRKACNALGDAVASIGFVLYAFAGNFKEVVLYEIIIGIGMAFTQGADSALLKAYCTGLKRSLFREQSILSVWRPIAQIIFVIIGGFIGAYSFSLAILLSAVPYVIGAILSLFMAESGERRKSHRNPIADMWAIVKDSVHIDKRLKWLIVAFAVSREITHPMIWALTPLLLLAGVPVVLVGFGWAMNAAMVSVGAIVAGHTRKSGRTVSEHLSEWQRFAVPTGLVIVSLAVMSIHLSAWTIWLYGCLGFAQGWTASVMMPMISAHARHDVQATVSSVALSASQLLYIPLVWIINAIGVTDVRLTMIATVIVFTPLVALTSVKLSRL